MSNKVLIYIDGKEIKAQDGKNLLQVAKKTGINIPSLCYHPRLSPSASCRLCVVKLNGNSTPVPACSTEVYDGLEITAFDKELESWRQKLLDLLMSRHNCNCINCDQAGHCKLQDLAYRYGIMGLSSNKFKQIFQNISSKISNFFWNIRPKTKNNYTSTEKATYSGRPSDCIRCGYCVEICPMYLNPVLIMEAQEYNNFKLLKRLYPQDCLTCGVCSYVCPAQINIPEYLRKAEKMKLSGSRNIEEV